VNPVNLLPAKHRPRTPTGGQQGSAYIVVGILGALLVMVVLYVLTVNSVNTRKDQVVRANADTARAQARAGSLTSYGDFSKVKDQRVQSVKQLAGGRIDWERLTRGLARVLPNEVWLTSASASASGAPAALGNGGGSTPAGAGATAASTGPKVELVGCAPSHDVVAVTLVRLRELSGAQDVQLNEITRPEPSSPAAGSSTTSVGSTSGGDGGCGLVHGQPAAKWDATVSFNANPGASTTGVPKSLGGGA
jgi:Tfp pilus assembly protein PilN